MSSLHWTKSGFLALNPANLPTIKYGAKGIYVAWAQGALNYCFAGRVQSMGGTTREFITALAVDGIFGPGTDAVVRSFQRYVRYWEAFNQNVPAVDGIIGPMTWSKLRTYVANA